jgi:alpha-galactosidase
MISRVLLAGVAVHLAAALDNGKALTPPRGFRTWNEFGLNVNQSLMTSIMDAMVAKTHSAWRPHPDSLCAREKGRPCLPGTTGLSVPTSFSDLGYSDVGLDDGWQLCNSGPGGKGYHNGSGYPNVDLSLFPDFKAMTAYAHSLNLTAGWCEFGGRGLPPASASTHARPIPHPTHTLVPLCIFSPLTP